MNETNDKKHSYLNGSIEQLNAMAQEIFDMKEFWIERHKLSFDKDFVKKFEDTIGSFLEDCIEGFIKTGFRVWNIEDAFCTHSTEEIVLVISEIMENDIALHSKHI